MLDKCVITQHFSSIDDSVSPHKGIGVTAYIVTIRTTTAAKHPANLEKSFPQ